MADTQMQKLQKELADLEARHALLEKELNDLAAAKPQINVAER